MLDSRGEIKIHEILEEAGLKDLPLKMVALCVLILLSLMMMAK